MKQWQAYLPKRNGRRLVHELVYPDLAVLEEVWIDPKEIGEPKSKGQKEHRKLASDPTN
jgi:hypothetical protein